MSDLKNPGAKIAPRFSTPQMLEQSQKDLLHNLLGIRGRNSHAQQISQQPVLKLIEKADHFLFQRRRPGLRFYPLNFFYNDTANTEIYTLSLHDALPIGAPG